MRVELAKFPGLKPLPSASNFFLCQVSDAPFTAGQLRIYLRRLGVLIRYFEKPAFMSEFIRISAGRRSDSLALLHALKLIYATPILKSTELRGALPLKGILFDMDGVLADESSSYRTAIILTAKSYGSLATFVSTIFSIHLI